MCGETNFKALAGALWLQAAIWGFHVPLFCAGMYVFARLRQHQIFIVTATATFSLCTVLLFLSFAGMTTDYYGTCYYECMGTSCIPCGEQTEELLHYADLNNLIDVIVNVLVLANEFICDSVIIWRCFVVWNKNYWIVAGPVILLLGTTGTYSFEIHSSVKLYLIRLHAPLSETAPPPQWIRYNQLYKTALPINDIISLCLNVIITALIVGRILYVTNDINGLAKMGRKQARRYKSIVSIFIESGALVVVACILQLTGSYVDNAFSTVTLSFLQQITGVAPTLLVIQSALISNTETDFDFSDVVAALSFQGAENHAQRP